VVKSSVSLTLPFAQTLNSSKWVAAKKSLVHSCVNAPHRIPESHKQITIPQNTQKEMENRKE